MANRPLKMRMQSGAKISFPDRMVNGKNAEI
jgi:hypothetical protein